MKIAVASIALNESEFVERWMKSSLDADLWIIGDTGSTDGTQQIARDLGIVVHDLTVRPWRFDTARNALLTLIPPDVDWIINLDMDEIMIEGWRQKIETAPADATRLSYDYVFSWTDDGKPDIQFRTDKVHSRFGWVWKHPCHEMLYPVGLPGKTMYAGFTIHHHSKTKTSRNNYLELLAMAVREDPTDDRMSHYYARELYMQGDWNAARKEFVRHLSLPKARWAAERAQSYRYIAAMDDNPEHWLWRAAAEDPERRGALVDLVDLYLSQQRLIEAAGMAQHALRITTTENDYISTSHSNDDTFLRDVVRRARSSAG